MDILLSHCRLSPAPIDNTTCQELYYHATTCITEDLETALSPTTFWHSYVSPLSYSNDAVRHALCALGGAHQVFKLQRNEHAAVQIVPKVSLEQYNKAIRRLNTPIRAANEGERRRNRGHTHVLHRLHHLGESIRSLYRITPPYESWFCPSHLHVSQAKRINFPWKFPGRLLRDTLWTGR